MFLFAKTILLFAKTITIIREDYITVRKDYITVREDYIVVREDYIIVREDYIIAREDYIIVREDYVSLSFCGSAGLANDPYCWWHARIVFGMPALHHCSRILESWRALPRSTSLSIYG